MLGYGIVPALGIFVGKNENAVVTFHQAAFAPGIAGSSGVARGMIIQDADPVANLEGPRNFIIHGELIAPAQHAGHLFGAQHMLRKIVGQRRC